jgi:hypothetical protein
LLLFTSIEFSLGGSSQTSTDKTNNKYTLTEQHKNSVQTIQNTVNTSTHVTKTPAILSKHSHIHSYPHITEQVKITTVQDLHEMK